MHSSFNNIYHSQAEKVNEKIRPQWSVIVPTYNCATLLKKTIDSVLEQDQGIEKMEIIVVDDHSTKDNPEKIINDHFHNRVMFYRHPINVGKSRNYAKGISLSKGQLIHILHGDDTVAKGFYQKMEKLFLANPDSSAAFCHCSYINVDGDKIGENQRVMDIDGVIPNFHETIAVWQLLQPPSIVFRRTVYETIGSYDFRLRYLEDWEFYVRASLVYNFAYTPDTLANYRIFENNSSSQSIKGGKRIQTIKQTIRIIDSYLPKKVKNKIRKDRKSALSIYLLNFIPKLMYNRDIKGVFITTKAFAIYNRNIRLWGRWIKFLLNSKKYI